MNNRTLTGKSREMPAKFDLNLEVERDSLTSTPSQSVTPMSHNTSALTPLAGPGPNMTPLADTTYNDSFLSARTTAITPTGTPCSTAAAHPTSSHPEVTQQTASPERGMEVAEHPPDESFVSAQMSPGPSGLTFSSPLRLVI